MAASSSKIKLLLEPEPLDELGTSREKCPNMDGCIIFPLLSRAGALKVWQDRYCSGVFSACERYKLGRLGRTVAPDLLPNGVRLGDRKKDEP